MSNYTDLIVFLAHVDSGKSTIVGRLLHDFDEIYRDKIDLFKKANPIFIRPSMCGRSSISSMTDTETNDFREYLHRNVADPVGRNLTVTPGYYHLKNIPNVIRPSLLVSSSSSTPNASATPSPPPSQPPAQQNQNNTFTFNLIDSPGHKDFLSAACKSMAGASIAVVVVSAAQGEFEAGLAQRTGQTRFAVLSAYAFGVKRFIFAINKLDAVEYAQQRYQEVKNELEAFLKRIIPIPSFLKNNTTFVPISAKFGDNFSVPSSDAGNNQDDDSSSASSSADNKMPWNEGHPTLIEALQLASIENYKMNTAPIRSGDQQHIPPSWERLPAERRKILEDRLINPLNQQGVPLRAMVFQVISNTQLTLKRRGFYDGKPRSKYLEKISEIVLVKVISGVLKLGDVLVFEPGTIARKVVSIGFDDDNESISFLDDHEDGNKNQTNLPSSQGPCGLASLGLTPLSDEEIHDFRQDRRRSDEIEYLQFSTNIEETQAAVQAHLQQHQHQNEQQQTNISHGDVITLFNKNGKRSFKHFPERQRELRKQQEKNLSLRHPLATSTTITTTTGTTTKEFGRFKKQYDVINRKSGFAFHIKSGSIVGHFLHPDAPRSYFADKDFVYIQLMLMYAPTSDSKLKSGFTTTFDCGTQNCPCRIQIVEKLDRTGKPLPETVTLANDEKGLREFLKLKNGDCARARLTPLYPHLPLIVDPLFFEGKGSNARTVLGRIVARSGNGRVVAVCAVRSLWMLRKWPFLIRFFGTGKSCEALQLWNVLVNVCLFLSWTV